MDIDSLAKWEGLNDPFKTSLLSLLGGPDSLREIALMGHDDWRQDMSENQITWTEMSSGALGAPPTEKTLQRSPTLAEFSKFELMSQAYQYAPMTMHHKSLILPLVVIQ